MQENECIYIFFLCVYITRYINKGHLFLGTKSYWGTAKKKIFNVVFVPCAQSKDNFFHIFLFLIFLPILYFMYTATAEYIEKLFV